MEDLQKRINDLFKDFEEDSKYEEHFLVNLERLAIIEKALTLESIKDFKQLLRLIHLIFKLRLWKKPLHSRIRYLKKIIGK